MSAVAGRLLRRWLRLAGVATVCAGSLANAAGLRLLSLEEAVSAAQAHQPQLRQAEANVAAARARADQARAALLPQVALNLGYSRSTANFAARPGALPSQLTSGSGGGGSFDTFDYFNGGLTANQLVYDFGQSSGRWRAAQASAEAEAQTEHSTRDQTLFNVRSAFFNARAAKALVSVARETFESQQRHLTQIEGFVEVGTRPPIDLAQARTDRANARVQVINAENSYDTSRAQLNQAMGVEQGTDYDVSDDALAALPGEDGAGDTLLEEAIAARPELASMREQARAEQLTLKSIEGTFWPSLGVSTGLSEAGRSVDQLAWNWSAGLSASWSLFQGGLSRAQQREAQARSIGLKALSDQVRQQVRLEVEQARLTVRSAKAGIEASAEALGAARERLRLSEGRYQTGVGSVLELSDAQLALNSAAAQKVQADYRLATARAQLLRALGRA